MRKIQSALISSIIFISLLGFYTFESENAGGGGVSIPGGHIAENTTWYHSQSPYYIEGDIYVDENITLTIEPGVDVRFNGDYGLFIDGSLSAGGLSERMINFTSNMSSPSVGDWNRIQVNLTGHADINYCNITYGNYSIYLNYSSNNKITNSNISLNRVYGIYGDNSFNNRIIANNIFSNSFWNIYLGSSSYNEIVDNNIYWAGVESGIGLSHSSNNSIAGNNIHSNGHYGIYLEYSSNNSIINNNLSSNPNENIYLFTSSNHNLFINNDISESAIGIDLDSSSYNIVMGNRIFSNPQIGIFAVDSSYNIITNNNISNNEYGLYIFASHHNQIYHNNIMDNTNQAIDDENDNLWNDSYPSGGNYWSDFDEPGEGAYDDYIGPGQDVLGSDGIVDKGTIGGGGKNPYVIDSDSRDNYPLMYPNLENSTYLQQGWNLISIPFLQSNTSLPAVLKSIEGEYDALQYYNASDKNDLWKHHHISKPTHLNDLNELTHKFGFWIHITTPGGTLFTYSGMRLFQNQTIMLHAGWNMVGYPSLTNKNRTNALNNLTYGDHIDAIWTYDAKTQRWIKIGESDYFEVGRGYYVHVKTECIWDVPL
ncbi:MAG: right-handed parallel beta-helix repeat-containing protein [Thermoplasmata archaeon]|nr:MAG: right-handed parallel beta-helix repeat-containing protein [Thermoplasmata archaeon]